jgi:hypothetical protein
VLAIVAGILVARHLKTTEDLFDTRHSPRTRSMVIAAVSVGEADIAKIDEECGSGKDIKGQLATDVDGVLALSGFNH